MTTTPPVDQRPNILASTRNAKMARSAHAYMRGNTVKFYEWLETAAGRSMPEGPSVWICGDCHVGNLGPIANVDGHVDIQIRDLDQTVIGNPVHDLIRLGLSLATAARSSNLPGVATARMVEQMVEGYERALIGKGIVQELQSAESASITRVLQHALRRRWKHLAQERIEDVCPTIPQGKRFWPPTKDERQAISELVATEELRLLVTSLRGRKNSADVHVLDSAYWVKGCSSLGRLRYAVLLGLGKKNEEICFLDIKEATTAAAPRAGDAQMPKDNAERVVRGAKALSPNLGERMLAAHLKGRAVVIRELLPQDLKLELEHLNEEEAISAARYLALVVGHAHARQMTRTERATWRRTLQGRRSKSLDVPSWLWSSIVDLMGIHEKAYLEHCRRLLIA